MSHLQDKIFNEKIIKRFLNNLEFGKNDCIEYTVNNDKRGYGNLSIGSRTDKTTVLAHRYALQFVLGGIIIPSNILVCHKCDNPSCVNPEHLFPGTHQDNMTDMKNKGRAATVFGNTTTNWETVDKIRTSKLRNFELVKELGLPKSTISEIRNNITWKEENRSKAIIK